MKTLWCKNQENPSERISHAWAPLMFSFGTIGYEKAVWASFTILEYSKRLQYSILPICFVQSAVF
jgi:hypothetical protein